jgi:hypothetical protein
MRTQREAEVAIEQGETRFEGVRWVTPQQIAANQVIPLPEPARRGLINAGMTRCSPKAFSRVAPPFGRPVDVRQMVRLEARTLCDRQWPASCLRDRRTTGFHRSAPCLPTAVLSDSMTCVSRNGR